MIAMFICNINILKIKINAFSVDMIQDNCHNLPYSKEVFIILSGPVLNIILYALFEFAYYILKIEFLNLFSIQNFIVGFINLLPISSLDGGRVLLILLEKKIDYYTSYKISCIVSVIFIIPIFLLGFCAVLRNFNFSILILAIYLSSLIIIRN